MTDFWEATEAQMVPSFGPSCLLYGLVCEALVLRTGRTAHEAR